MSPFRTLLELRMMRSGDDNCSYNTLCYNVFKSSIKSSSQTNQHPDFLQGGCPSCRPTNSVRALKLLENITFHALFTPSSAGGLPTLSLTAKDSWLPSGGLPWLSSVLCASAQTYSWENKGVLDRTTSANFDHLYCQVTPRQTKN